MSQRLLGILLLGLVSACSAEPPADTAAPAEPPRFVAGRDYTLIEPAVPTRSGDKVEVVEVFGYSCIHCAHLQPLVNDWKKTLPEQVHFEYMPAVFGGAWEVFARAYYTAETMGLLDKTHDRMFDAVHEEQRFNSVEDIAGFYAEHGASKDAFLSTMSSFPVEAKIADARRIVQAYGVEGTPTMVVEGKYRVSVPREGGQPRMLEIVDFLIARELAEQRSDS